MAKKAKKAKKASSRKKRSVGTPHLKMALLLDKKKIADIQSCLKKGTLTITVSKIEDIGRSANSYLYD